MCRCGRAAPRGRVLLAVALLAAAAGAAHGEDVVELLRTDSRSTYIHRITLYDHAGAAIDPADPFAGPYSPIQTCGKCHPVAEIRHGWHFNELEAGAPAGRPGEPWFIVDDERGLPVAVSDRGWPGTVTPAEAGLSAWDMLQRFGHHLPGGSFGDPPADVIRQSEKMIRWGISGPLEIDCLFCHAADQLHDPAEAERQIQSQNYKWAATAAAGLAVIRGAAAKAPDDWDPLMPPNPDFPEQAGPKLIWDKTRFDPDGRVHMALTTRIQNERCYFCHTVRSVGPGAPHATVASQDVHLAAGLLCVDCHRNGLDHAIVRGYWGEATERGEPSRMVLSCRGCHMGTASVGDEDEVAAAGGLADPNLAAEIALGGRYGAPHPQHRGIPPLHFEKMTCTACHSGPWPARQPHRVQTALAHELGLASRERGADDPPWIWEPIFGRNRDGQIEPQRVVWTKGPDGEPTAYAWPLAHDVRPARQSLGINGCTDCHARGAAMYEGLLVAGDVDLAKMIPAATMYELRGEDKLLLDAWALGFVTRPAFKVFGLACAALIALLLLQAGTDGVYRVSGGPVAGVAASATTATAATSRPRLTLLGHAFHTILMLAIVNQFVTAIVIGNLAEFTGWTLLAHMLGAGAFVFGLTGTTLLWVQRERAGSGLHWTQRASFWLMLVAGFVVMATMLSAMLPIAGYAGQHALLEAHETAAVALVILAVLHTAASLAARRRKA